MTQYKLVIRAGSLQEAQSISDSLDSLAAPEALAVSMFETRSQAWTVDAYYAEQPDVAAVLAALPCQSRTAHAAAGKVATSEPDWELPAISCEAIPNDDWVALSQAGLPPVTAGRFVVHGSHDRERLSHKREAIEIDAGEAFGTAHHATTLGCLLAIGKLARRRNISRVPDTSILNELILDLGCGSGLLAIAAAIAVPSARIIASDIDPQATNVARQNSKLNGKARCIDVITALGFQHPRLQRPRQFDVVIANILAAPLIELAPDMARAAKPAGIAILSGILVTQALEVSAAYRAAGFKIIAHKRLGEWSTLTLQRRMHRPKK